MGATGWLIVSIAGYSLAAVLLVAAAVLFFKLDIPAIVGDLSGRTAARKIMEIREQNQNKPPPAVFHPERGVLRDPVGRSGRFGKTAQAMAHQSKRLDLSGGTGEKSHLTETIVELTEVLGVQRTEVFTDEDRTALLDITAELENEEQTEFKIVKDVIVVHTTEVI